MRIMSSVLLKEIFFPFDKGITDRKSKLLKPDRVVIQQAVSFQL